MPPMDFGNGPGPYNPYDPNSQAFLDRLAQENAMKAGMVSGSQSLGTNNAVTGIFQMLSEHAQKELDAQIAQNTEGVAKQKRDLEEQLKALQEKEQTSKDTAKILEAQRKNAEIAAKAAKEAAEKAAEADIARQEAEKRYKKATKDYEKYGDTLETISKGDCDKAASEYASADIAYRAQQNQADLLNESYNQAVSNASATEIYYQKQLYAEEKKHDLDVLTAYRDICQDEQKKAEYDNKINKARVDLANANRDVEKAKNDAKSEMLVAKSNQEEISKALRDVSKIDNMGSKSVIKAKEQEYLAGASTFDTIFFSQLTEVNMLFSKCQRVADEAKGLNDINERYTDFGKFADTLSSNKYNETAVKNWELRTGKKLDYNAVVKEWELRTGLKLDKQTLNAFKNSKEYEIFSKDFVNSKEYKEIFNNRFTKAPTIDDLWKKIRKGSREAGDNDESLDALDTAKNTFRSVQSSVHQVASKENVVLQQKKAIKINARQQRLRIRKENALRTNNTKALNKIEKAEKKLAKAKKATKKPQKMENVWAKTPMGRFQQWSGAAKNWFFNNTLVGKLLKEVATFFVDIKKWLLAGAAGLMVGAFQICCGITLILVIFFLVTGFLNYKYSPGETSTYILYSQLLREENIWKDELTNPINLWDNVKSEDFRFGPYYLPWSDYASRKPHLIYYDDRFELGIGGTFVDNQVYVNPFDFCPAFPDQYFIKIDGTGTPVAWPGSDGSADIEWICIDDAISNTTSDDEMIEEYGEWMVCGLNESNLSHTGEPNDSQVFMVGSLNAYAEHFRCFDAYDSADDEWSSMIWTCTQNDPWWNNFKYYDETGNNYLSTMWLRKYTAVTWPDQTPFMQGAFGDAGVMIEYLPNVSGSDMYGNSGHTSNVKDIICMMDVMFEFEPQSDEGILDRMEDAGIYDADEIDFDFVKSYILQLAKDALKLLHNFFVDDADKWPLDVGLEEWKRMTTYARTLFHASHQEIIDIDVIIFDCTKNPGDDGYLMSTDAELGRIDATDVAYMDTQLGALLHSGCPMQYDENGNHLGGCSAAKIEAQIYNRTLAENKIANYELVADGSIAPSRYIWTNVQNVPTYSDSLIGATYDDDFYIRAGWANESGGYYNNDDVRANFDINFGLGMYGFPIVVGSDDRGDYAKANTGAGGIGIIGTLNRYERGIPQFDYVTFQEDTNFCLPDTFRNYLSPTSNIYSRFTYTMTDMDNLWRNCGENEGCWYKLVDGEDSVDLVRDESFSDSSIYYRYVYDPSDIPSDPSDYDCEYSIPSEYDGIPLMNQHNIGRNSIDYVRIDTDALGSRIVVGGYTWKATSETVTINVSCDTEHVTPHENADDDHWHHEDSFEVTKYEMKWTVYIWSTCYMDKNVSYWGGGTVDGEWNALGKKLDASYDDIKDNSYFGNHSGITESGNYEGFVNFLSYTDEATDGAKNQSRALYCTCKGHNCRFCGGHTLVNVKGIIFSFTDDELAAVGGKTAKDTDNLRIVPVYDEDVKTNLTSSGLKGWANTAGTEGSLFGRSYYSLTDIDGINLLIDGTWQTTGYDDITGQNAPVRVAPELMESITSVRQYTDGWHASWDPGDGTYAVDSMLFVAQDIFDIDASLEWGLGIFPYTDVSEYPGWTESSMQLALLKYIMSWEDTYMFDIPVNMSSPQLSDSQIDDIIKAVGGDSMTKGQKEAVKLALQAVGNGQYSQEHHSHGYLMYDCNRPSTTTGIGITYDATTLLDIEQGDGNTSHSCTCTDASGFCSYIKCKGEAGAIWDIDDFKNSSLTHSWGGWDSASSSLKPGDILIHYPNLTPDDPDYYKDDNSHHVMVYIGTPSEDLVLTWMGLDGTLDFYYTDEAGGEYMDIGVYNGLMTPHVKNVLIFKAGEPIFVDCTRLDQTGNIYLRGGVSADRKINNSNVGSWNTYGYFYMADETMMEYVNSGDDMYYYRPTY